jgi:hypothetical protein
MHYLLQAINERVDYTRQQSKIETCMAREGEVDVESYFQD